MYGSLAAGMADLGISSPGVRHIHRSIGLRVSGSHESTIYTCLRVMFQTRFQTRVPGLRVALRTWAAYQQVAPYSISSPSEQCFLPTLPHSALCMGARGRTLTGNPSRI